MSSAWLCCLKLQGSPSQGGCQLHCPGHHHEPSWTDWKWICPSSRLPHFPHCCQVWGDFDQDRQVVGSGTSEGASVPSEWSCWHGSDDSHQANGGSNLCRKPTIGSFCCERHEANCCCWCCQECSQEGPNWCQGHQGCPEEGEANSAVSCWSFQCFLLSSSVLCELYFVSFCYIFISKKKKK
uniref:Elongation factor 1 alpha n=1 Tax=Capsicum annuum TaxID=4072 RepID=A0A1B4WGC6_CAPAN|nr:elongation factor 1 alpha [Capsicum annuum]